MHRRTARCSCSTRACKERSVGTRARISSRTDERVTTDDICGCSYPSSDHRRPIVVPRTAHIRINRRYGNLAWCVSPLFEPKRQIVAVRPPTVQLRRQQAAHDNTRQTDNPNTRHTHMRSAVKNHRVTGNKKARYHRNERHHHHLENPSTARHGASRGTSTLARSLRLEQSSSPLSSHARTKV